LYFVGSQSAHWARDEQTDRSYGRAISVPDGSDRVRDATHNHADHDINFFQHGFSVTSEESEQQGENTTTTDVTQVSLKTTTHDTIKSHSIILSGLKIIVTNQV